MTDVLANDAAARSPTGEILEPSQIKTPEPETKPAETEPKPEPEAKPAAEAKPDEKKKEASVLNEKGTPEKYDDFKLPDGFALAEESLAEATTLFKELGLSQERAQKLVDFHVKSTQEAFDAPFNLWKETQETWKNEIKSDPKLGHRLAEVKTNFARMLDGLGDQKLAQEFREAMDYTGAGNNPAFIRFIDTISQRLTEGGHVSGVKPAPVRAPGEAAAGPSAHALYPNLK